MPAPRGIVIRMVDSLPPRRRRKTSLTASGSLALRFLASDSKATYRPSPLIAGESDSPSPTAPKPLARLTSVVVLASRSRT